MAEVIIFLTAVTVHELSHIISAKLLDVRLISVSPRIIGAALTFDFSSTSYVREALVHISGSVGGLSVSFAAVCLSLRYSRELFGISAVLSVLNLLPITGLDGGAALRAILHMLTSPSAAEKISSAVSATAIVLLWTASLWIELRIGGDFSCILITTSLLVSLACKR